MSGDDIAIKVSDLSKCYHIYDKPHDRLKQSIYRYLQRFVGKPARQYCHEFWALKNVSFEIKKGETIGIIGRNGSGKSTLLQLICGTLAPTHGTVETNGRVAALLELGSGFNPEFTGRENVYMNGALLGLSQDEVKARFEEVAAFADIGEFIEQPVKTYSSGMFIRLAFASNIMAKPEIMVVDEALAVGDMNFQAKCMTALTRIQERGATVLFVSHDIGTVKSLCSRGIYLDRGAVKAIGKAPEVADQYFRVMREEMNVEQRKFVRASSEFTPGKTDNKEGPEAVEGKSELAFKQSDEFSRRVAAFRYGSGGARISFVELLNMSDEPIQSIEFNQEVKLRIYCEVLEDVKLSIAFQILDEKRNNIIGSGFREAGKELLGSRKGHAYVVTYMLMLPLRDGIYSIQAHAARPVNGSVRPDYMDVVPDALVFKVMRREPVQVWSAVYMFPRVEIERVGGGSAHNG